MGVKSRKWWLAGFLSLFIPGLGQTYNGEIRKGLWFLFGKAAIDFVGGFAMVKGINPAPILIMNDLYHVVIAFEAAFQATRIDSPSLVAQTLRAGYQNFLTALGGLLLIPLFTYVFLFQAFKIHSGAMEDTLLIGDHVLINKFIYGARIPFTDTRIFKSQDIGRGNILVFEVPPTAILDPNERKRHVRKDFIKRVIGLPGDTIAIKDKEIFINGMALSETYAVFKDPRLYPMVNLNLSVADYQQNWESGKFSELNRSQIGDNFGPIKIPNDSYFVLGDNRDGSFDSRYWGPVPSKLVIGKAVLIYYPSKRRKNL